MNKEQDYIQDIADIRSMMERSTKFLSLSGLAGVTAGIYALAGAWIAHSIFGFYPDTIFYTSPDLSRVVLLALGVLILALVTAIWFSMKKAGKRGEQVWNTTSRRLLLSMAIPLFTGGIVITVFITYGLTGLIAPLTLLFYGLALYNAGNYTINEVKFMGLVQIGLGVINLWYIEFGLLIWAFGFGVVHMVYGIYMHYRYER